MECNRHLVIKHVAWRHTDLSMVAICMASAADLSFVLVCLKWANKVHFFSADMNCRECWKPHLFLLHLHCVPRCLLDCFFLLSLCLFVHLSVFLIRFQEYWRGMPQVKVEPTLSQTLIIEEGRRRENGSCNIHMSYWLDCQPLAHAPSTYEVSQMTEDAMLCPPPSPASLLSPFSSHYTFSHLPSICHLLFLHSLPLSAASPPVPFSFSLPLLLIPFSSAAISLKIMACPWAKFNYRPN